MKKILENEQGKYGWTIKVYTENIYSNYYNDYFRAYGSDQIFESKYILNDANCSVYVKREG